MYILCTTSLSNIYCEHISLRACLYVFKKCLLSKEEFLRSVKPESLSFSFHGIYFGIISNGLPPGFSLLFFPSSFCSFLLSCPIRLSWLSWFLWRMLMSILIFLPRWCPVVAESFIQGQPFLQELPLFLHQRSVECNCVGLFCILTSTPLFYLPWKYHTALWPQLYSKFLSWVLSVLKLSSSLLC